MSSPLNLNGVVNGRESEGRWYRTAVNIIGHYGLKDWVSAKLRRVHPSTVKHPSTIQPYGADA